MFFLDDVLLGPGKAALMVFKELARKVEEDWLDDDAVKQELQEIYALVEAGKISSQEFEARECKLLERLEQIARARFNDKWGPGDGQAVIEGEVSAEPTPWEIAPAPVMATTPPMKTPWLLEPLLETSAPVAPAAPVAPVTLVEQVAPVAHVAPAAQVAPEAPMAPTAPTPVAPAPVPPMAPKAPLAPVAAPVAPMAPAAPLSIAQVFESTARALALLNLKVSVITSVAPDEGGWRVSADLVERRGIPDTNDLIGVYELRLDAAGNVLRYERTRLRRRGDLGH